MDDNIKNYLDLCESYNVKKVHTDLVFSIINIWKKYILELKKYCIWHFLRALEINKNKICSEEVKNDDKWFVLYKY